MLERAAEMLGRELRDGDLVFVKGRSVDHLSRIVFARFWLDRLLEYVVQEAAGLRRLRRAPARIRPAARVGAADSIAVAACYCLTQYGQKS